MHFYYVWRHAVILKGRISKRPAKKKQIRPSPIVIILYYKYTIISLRNGWFETGRER